MRGSLCGSSSIQGLLNLRGTAPNLSIKKVVGLILGILVISLPPAETQSAAVVTENEDSVQRGIDANAAQIVLWLNIMLQKRPEMGVRSAKCGFSGLTRMKTWCIW